jgi:chromosome segregation ATPase
MNALPATPHSEPQSNKSGRILIGALGVALVFGGVSSKINNDLTTENHSLEGNVARKAEIITTKEGEIAVLSAEGKQLTRDKAALEKTGQELHHQVVTLTTDLTETKLKVVDLDKKLVATTATL